MYLKDFGVSFINHMILLPGMCFIVSFLLQCCKHVVDISHFVLYFILYDMYVLPIIIIIIIC